MGRTLSERGCARLSEYTAAERERVSADALHGWKEIAAYLGCSVNTATNWHNKWSLPVIRTPGRKVDLTP